MCQTEFQPEEVDAAHVFQALLQQSSLQLRGWQILYWRIWGTSLMPNCHFSHDLMKTRIKDIC